MRNKAIHRALDGMGRCILERFDPDQIILLDSHARGAGGPDGDVEYG